MKAGWTPVSHTDSFGLYADSEPASLRLGRLTTTVRSSTQSVTGGAPTQPKLVSSDIPMLPGRYIQFYQNIAQTIKDVEAARAESKEGVAKALESLFIKPQDIILTTKCILLARKSAEQGKTLAWE